MKIIAWNVNGLRSLLKTEYFDKLLLDEDPDVLCMGETKLPCPVPLETHGCKTINSIESEIIKNHPKYKYRYWSSCKNKGGYSGTAIFSKKEPLSVMYGLENLDDEGRVITVEFKKYYLIHVYTPNSGVGLNRLEWRTETWDRAFEKYIKHLQKTKPVIVCGDLNVAHKPIDLKNPKTNLRTAGYTEEERKSFEKLLEKTELIDSFRHYNPETIKYSYWSYRFKSRQKNIGWRIDYFLVNNSLINKVKKSDILDNILGSDHAPILLEIKN
jgi:exodeoxyribonuclease-3